METEVSESRLQIEEIKGIKDLLNDKAKALANNIINHTIYHDKINEKIYFCVYATMLFPLDSNGEYNLNYPQRWANFLNHLADTGTWQIGALSPYGFIKLLKHEGVQNAVFFSYIYTKYSVSDMESFDALINKLNTDFGVKVFVPEGCVGEDTWETFPY